MADGKWQMANLRLVIAGAWDERYPEAHGFANSSGAKISPENGHLPAPSNQLPIWLGPVPEAELPGLYWAAAAFVFPSLYEGFGLPVLEAMACGTPVICSDASSLPEVEGDRSPAVLVDPIDTDALAAAHRHVLADAACGPSGVTAGWRRMRFSWRRRQLRPGHLSTRGTSAGVCCMERHDPPTPAHRNHHAHPPHLQELPAHPRRHRKPCPTAGAGQAAAGHTVTVLVTNPERMRTTVMTEAGVTVIRAARLATVASTPLSLALPWQLLRQRPDVVHLHYPYPLGEVSQWLLRHGRATVLSYHADIVRQASILRFYKPLLRRVLRWADAIIIGSPPMRGGAFLGEHQAKLTLIPYGIPLARFRAEPAEADLRVMRARLPCADVTPAARVRQGSATTTVSPRKHPDQLPAPRSPHPAPPAPLRRPSALLQGARLADPRAAADPGAAGRGGYRSDGGGVASAGRSGGRCRPDRLAGRGARRRSAHTLPPGRSVRAARQPAPARRSAWCRWRRWRRACRPSAPSWAPARLTSTATASPAASCPHVIRGAGGRDQFAVDRSRPPRGPGAWPPASVWPPSSIWM